MVEEVIVVKKWWTSKTLWTNVAIVVAGVITIISGQIAAGIPITVLGVVNGFLRVMTQEGIEF